MIVFNSAGHEAGSHRIFFPVIGIISKILNIAEKIQDIGKMLISLIEMLSKVYK
jgi:hypothetical protein